MKKITCFIESLSAGGAQRQICYLANFLRIKHYEVTILTYHNDSFFADELKKNDIHIVNLENKNKLIKFKNLIYFLRNHPHDLVIAYLRNPSLIAEIAKLFQKKWKLIVSERNNHIDEKYLYLLIRRIFHLLADYVVVNSKTNLRSIIKKSPWLTKVSLIYNFTDLNYFIPKKDKHSSQNKTINFLGIGKYTYQKNILNLIKAFNIVKTVNPDIKITLNWFGDNFSNFNSKEYLKKVYSLIDQFNLKAIINLNGPTEEILDQYNSATAIILPSFYEGFPNVLSEAMACGLPILASDVCDNSLLVDSTNGFLFNPASPQDIANKIFKFCELSDENIDLLSINSRNKAKKFFDQKIFINEYLNIIRKLI